MVQRLSRSPAPDGVLVNARYAADASSPSDCSASTVKGISMKMAKRRLKHLEEMGLRVLNKPRITEQPTNRAERRALAKAKRKKK